MAPLPSSTSIQPICKARAIYPFHSKEPTALNFEPGIFIDVLSKVESGWWLGCTPGNAPGWFPKDYVEVIEPQKPMVRH
ncbi:SH3 domain-containing protein [Phascolomyces articulosus]|uniref:SH3 domain-containing protein n=1 Tax=Phascolomyces articulosus TaxID=60185 RepID=A0AAD5P7C2_9FUNG|nr:SH3 domain-containing protein [Phascolomyces articulosus]